MTTIDFDSLYANAPAVPSAPSWATSRPGMGWDCASGDGELKTFYERVIGRAGEVGTGLDVTVSQAVTCLNGAIATEAPEVLVGGILGNVVVSGRDVRALAGLLLAAADLLERVEVTTEA